MRHIVKTGRSRRRKARRAQSALRVIGAVGCAMADFQNLARADKNRGVFSNRVAAAHDGEADFVRAPFFRRRARAGENRLAREVAAARRRQRLAQAQSGSGRRIALFAVVHFENLDIVAAAARARAQKPRRRRRQFEQRINADACVGRDDDGDFFARAREKPPRAFVVRRRADDQRASARETPFDILRRRRGQRKIDERVRARGAGRGREW